MRVVIDEIVKNARDFLGTQDVESRLSSPHQPT
jgi:hypothetical protein